MSMAEPALYPALGPRSLESIDNLVNLVRIGMEDRKEYIDAGECPLLK